MNPLKFALIGDVHAEDELLKTVLDWLRPHKWEAILCVGDVVDGAGDAARCIQLLRENSIWTVRGNHDSWFAGGYGRDLSDATPLDEIPLSERAWLRNLPATRAFSTSLGPLLLCHGVGENDMAQLAPDAGNYALESNEELQKILREGRFRVMVGGHTHQRMAKKIGALLAVNPGTLKRTHQPGFAVLDCAARNVQFWDVTSAGVQAADLVGF